MNSKYNGMPSWVLSKEKCPATKGFVGGTLIPGKISATTRKTAEEKDDSRRKFVDITGRKEK